MKLKPENRRLQRCAICNGQFMSKLGKPDDNREENLFICGSFGELHRRRAGTLPWPQSSNLRSYERRLDDHADQA